MEYDNDHNGGREELSAFLGCSAGVSSDWVCASVHSGFGSSYRHTVLLGAPLLVLPSR